MNNKLIYTNYKIYDSNINISDLMPNNIFSIIAQKFI